jgi:hypothetical protein
MRGPLRADMYPEPLCGAEGLRDQICARPRLLLPPVVDESGRCDTGIKPCRLQVEKSGPYKYLTARTVQACCNQKRWHSSRFSFFGFFQKNGDGAV